MNFVFIKDIQADISDLQADVSDLQKESAETKERVDADYKRLNLHMEWAHDRYTEIAPSLKDHEDILKEHRHDINSLVESVHSIRKDRNIDKGIERKILHVLDEYKADFRDQDDATANLRELYETLMGDVKSDREEFSLLEEKVNRLRGWVTTKETEIQHLNKALESALQCIAALDRKVEVMQNVQDVLVKVLAGKQ
jgi:chromosome segregation ATPase